VTDPQLGVLMLILFVGLIMLGFPIAFTLMAMAVGFAYLAFDGNWEPVMSLLVQRTWSVMTNDILISVPLFVFMGYIIERANILDRLFRSIQLAAGGLPGSLAVATLITCALFATATGIVGAVVTLMGLLAFPVMLRHGYDVRLSSGVICAGGCLGILIPPSIMLILYGATAGVSPVQLYAGALFPGLMLAGLYIAYVMIRAVLNPKLAPPLPAEERNVPFSTVFYELVTSFVPLALLIFAVLGAIMFGIATPFGGRGHRRAGRTHPGRRLPVAQFREAEGVGLSHGAHIGHGGLALRRLLHLLGRLRHSWRRCGDQGFRGGPRSLALHVPAGHADHHLHSGLAAGMDRDHRDLRPIFLPLLDHFGIDPLFFGLLIALNIQTSFLSPPVAMAPFYLKGVAPKEVNINDIFAGVMPFIFLVDRLHGDALHLPADRHVAAGAALRTLRRQR
jgi:TRAP-type mannitol/chloroaromatic compound transport system permease large subunit